ncbi:MAG: rod-binding protein [Alphaproteobacteria bacterium]|nr:rod-binding protein [Alphaproteobacteria bacterium]
MTGKNQSQVGSSQTGAAPAGQFQASVLQASEIQANVPPDSKAQQKAAKAAQDFEAMFIGQMLKPMFDGLGTDGMFGGGQGEEMFRGLLIDEYGKAIARAGGIGISGAIMKTMLAARSEHHA